MYVKVRLFIHRITRKHAVLLFVSLWSGDDNKPPTVLGKEIVAVSPRQHYKQQLSTCKWKGRLPAQLHHSTHLKAKFEM